ncbi:hypothetical protein BLOT_004357 [Blomia tropicalis]|nr:hypothetical protein BLOT_004357 [Blomia tropicalis]
MAMTADQRNLVTKLLGEYMLKGFTLLDSHCDSCLTPLMKRRDEKSFCVFCDIISKPEASSQTPESEQKIVTQKIENIEPKCDDFKSSLDLTIKCIVKKLEWCCKKLESCDSIEECMKLNQLIQSTLETLEKMEKLNQSFNMSQTN